MLSMVVDARSFVVDASPPFEFLLSGTPNGGLAATKPAEGVIRTE
jgi:hypothetical protein